MHIIYIYIYIYIYIILPTAGPPSKSPRDHALGASRGDYAHIVWLRLLLACFWNIALQLRNILPSPPFRSALSHVPNLIFWSEWGVLMLLLVPWLLLWLLLWLSGRAPKSPSTTLTKRFIAWRVPDAHGWCTTQRCTPQQSPWGPWNRGNGF